MSAVARSIFLDSRSGLKYPGAWPEDSQAEIPSTQKFQAEFRIVVGVNVDRVECNQAHQPMRNDYECVEQSVPGTKQDVPSRRGKISDQKSSTGTYERNKFEEHLFHNGSRENIQEEIGNDDVVWLVRVMFHDVGDTNSPDKSAFSKRWRALSIMLADRSRHVMRTPFLAASSASSLGPEAHVQYPLAGSHFFELG